MVKRNREKSIQFDFKDGVVIINQYGKQYAWMPPLEVKINSIVSNATIDCNVIHNYQKQAMINIEDLRKNTTVFRQEINPLKYKNSENWEVDDE